MKRFYIIIYSSLIFLAGCGVPKDIAYFQGIEKLTNEQLGALILPYTPTIYPGDMLSILVFSKDADAVAPYNPPYYSSTKMVASLDEKENLKGFYPVDPEGMIDFPQLGQIQVGGLSPAELEELIRVRLARQVEDVSVKIDIINYEVTLIGEVRNPGRLRVTNNKLTILEAIGAAGDLGLNAERKNVLVIRRTHGEPEYGFVDMTDVSLFSSPYYYLRQRDVIYVEPNDAKKLDSRFSTERYLTFRTVNTLLDAAALVTTWIQVKSEEEENEEDEENPENSREQQLIVY